MSIAQQWIAHMPFVRFSQLELIKLSGWWQSVNMVGKINSDRINATLMQDLEATRQSYQDLQDRLIEQLIREQLAEVNTELADKAQVAIDLLKRNLYERTADVGFLAQDNEIRRYLSEGINNSDKEYIRSHLQEYTSKYSVYDEVILLDTQGRVLVHLDDSNPIGEVSEDALIQDALTSENNYLEVYRYSDLKPLEIKTHLFASRIMDHDNPGASTLGVLCLSFQLNDEMQRTFGELAKPSEQMAILDEANKVILSNDHHNLPLGNRYPSHSGPIIAPDKQQGNKIYCCKSSKGYQGYSGLHWSALVANPISDAFRVSIDDSIESQGDSAATSNVEGGLIEIIKDAKYVTDSLDLVALNGEISALKHKANAFIPILNEIRSIGRQTHEAFKRSIKSLQTTMTRSMMEKARFHAFLAITTMDRNLYERANDTRWWALASQFRTALSQEPVVQNRGEQLSASLEKINHLYTVYTNILIVDLQGEIIAVSNTAEQALIGQKVPDEAPLSAMITLDSTRDYCVSGFTKTKLYGDQPTYLYCAAIRAPASNSVVGGLITVFDSEPEFRAMLEDALPRNDNGKVKPGTFGLIVEQDGRIVSSSTPEHRVGSQITIEPTLLAVRNGKRVALNVRFKQSDYIVGAAASSGYREYKVSDGYSNDLIALIFIPLKSEQNA